MRSQRNTSGDPVTILMTMIFVIICLLFFLFLQTQGGLYSPFPYRHLAPFSGKVVDADTDRPLAGAVVLAVYYMTTSSVAGQNDYIVDGRETLTDENGEFNLPEKRKWLRLQRGYPEAKLIIFKPGYGVFPRHKRSEAVGENKSWPSPRKFIIYKISQLATTAERKRNLPGIFPFDEIAYKNQKMYINANDTERKALGLTPYPDFTKENNHVSKNISHLLKSVRDFINF